MSPPDAQAGPSGRSNHTPAVHRLVQSVRERAKGIRGLTATVAVTILLILVGLAAWRCATDRRLGRIELINEGAPLLAQVFPEFGDDPLGEPFDLVDRETLTLPDGDYRLRVNGVGRLGRTYRFAVNRGESQVHPVSLEEGRLLGAEPTPQMGMQEKVREQPIPFAPTTVAAELTPGKADLIEWNMETITRRDGLTGKPVWDALHPLIPRQVRDEDAIRIRRVLEDNGRQLNLVGPAQDLDEDGTRDVVLCAQNMTSFVALSGRSGSVLWEHMPELDGSENPRPDDLELPGPTSTTRRPVYLAGPPSMSDMDRDGTPDLLATLIFSEFPTETEQTSAGTARIPG